MTYELVRVASDDASIERSAALLADVFGAGHLDADFLRWQYRDNPAGPVIGFEAIADDELAAHYVTIPVDYILDGEPRKALLSLNTATHPSHQGKGLFTKLANATYDLAEQEGFDFVIGVANQNSTHGFVKKLGFRLVSPLDVRIGFGGIDSTRASETYRLSARHDDAFLAWRLAKPGASYGRRGATIDAATGSMGVRALLGNASPTTARAVAPTRLAWLRPAMWIGLASRRATKGMFASLPQRLRPSPLNLIIRDVSSNVPPDLGAADIRFDLIDFDAY